MNALRNWLIARGGTAKATAADLQAQLAAEVVVVQNSARLSITDVASVLGYPALLALVGKLKGSPFEPLLMAAQSGCRYDDPQTRGAIEACRDAGVLSKEEANALLELGIKHGPEWQRAGMEALPTVEDIQAAQATIASEELREEIATRYQCLREAVDSGDVLTIEAAVALFSTSDEATA
jgi:hypothetical protein